VFKYIALVCEDQSRNLIELLCISRLKVSAAVAHDIGKFMIIHKLSNIYPSIIEVKIRCFMQLNKTNNFEKVAFNVKLLHSTTAVAKIKFTLPRIVSLSLTFYEQRFSLTIRRAFCITSIILISSSASKQAPLFFRVKSKSN
jgi:hypothetical protein